jgi:hypothetical protein
VGLRILYRGRGFLFQLLVEHRHSRGRPRWREPILPWLSDLERWIFEDLALLVIMISVVATILLITIAPSTVSRAALTESVAALQLGETRGFGSALRAGLSNFWRPLGLGALFS